MAQSNDDQVDLFDYDQFNQNLLPEIQQGLDLAASGTTKNSTFRVSAEQSVRSDFLPNWGFSSEDFDVMPSGFFHQSVSKEALRAVWQDSDLRSSTTGPQNLVTPLPQTPQTFEMRKPNSLNGKRIRGVA